MASPPKPLDMTDKVVYTFYTMFLFFALANPRTFELVQKLLGRFITISNNGCPTCAGLIVHSIVFGLLTFGLMELTSYMKDKKK
jgi:hypothetical protein